MTISAPSSGFFADFRRVRIVRPLSATAVLAALAVPATAEGERGPEGGLRRL